MSPRAVSMSGVAGATLDATPTISPMLALEHLPAAQLVDRTVLRGGHEPRARVLRNADRRPPFERGDERRAAYGQPWPEAAISASREPT